VAQSIVAIPQGPPSVEVEKTTVTPLSLLSVPPTSRGRGGVPFSESLRSSLQSLSANMMRTALTMLGIIIGVGAVVALLAIGNGVVATAREKLEANGTNLITVQGLSRTLDTAGEVRNAAKSARNATTVLPFCCVRMLI